MADFQQNPPQQQTPNNNLVNNIFSNTGIFFKKNIGKHLTAGRIGTVVSAGIGAIAGAGLTGGNPLAAITGAGVGSLVPSWVRGGGAGRFLSKAGNGVIDVSTRFSNYFSNRSLLGSSSKRVALGAIIGFFVLFFILGSISGLPISAPTGETAPIPLGTTSTASALTSELSCTTSMSAKDINNYFEKEGYYNFSGTGQAFYDAAQSFKVNPALVIAIGVQESNLGILYRGQMAENAKNAFGLIQRDSLMRFDSWAEGVTVTFRTVNSFKCSSIECIGQKYAPVGAANDPKNLNQYWVPNVSKFFNSIPQTSCAPLLAKELAQEIEQAGIPSGWPTTGRIEQGPYEGFSHSGQNAIDISNPNPQTPVYSTLSGMVVDISYTDTSGGKGYGVKVVIKNFVTGAEVLYAHLIPNSNSHLYLEQQVNKGDLIGLMDSTGFSTGSHLHYEIRGSIKDSSLSQYVPGGSIAKGTVIK